jgi:3'(2'), 5'-bisphosphate nucleotidase
MLINEIKVAVDAVRQAVVLAELVSNNLNAGSSMLKTDASPVTVADYGVQAIIHRCLAHAYPNDPIVAEEDTDDLQKPEQASLAALLIDVLNQSSLDWTMAAMLEHVGRGNHSGGGHGRFWTLDPIDGTKGFIRGDQYAIALALIENGQPILGVLGCPRLKLKADGLGTHTGWISVAANGEAYAESIEGMHRRPLSASKIVKTEDIVMCESFESGHSAHDVSAVIAQELGIHRPPVRMDSQAKYTVVAAGEADAYLRLPTRADYREKIWDHAAGVLIVQTAGGVVGDVEGKPLDFSQGRTLKNNRGVIATAAGVHARVTQTVKPHFPA